MLRWLLTQGRLSEAETIVRKIAAFNGRTLPPDFKLSKPGGEKAKSDPDKRVAGEGMLGFLDLFKTPNMRKKTLIIYYLWFASTFVYYGLTLNSNGFGASLFVSFMIGKGDWQSNMLYHFSSISSVADKIFSNSH